MYDHQKLDTLPNLSGVYLMKNNTGNVLYVGKAKNIRNRVKQYFAPGRDSRPIIPLLVSQIEDVSFIVVSSEKEALLLENTLIKQHQPKYNILLKDDKGFVALQMTTQKTWPMLKLLRFKGKPEDKNLYFGPYSNAQAAKNMVDLLSRLFPLRQCTDAEFARRTRPCILYDMKKCIAPCVGRCTHEEYNRNVNNTIRFLKGHTQEVLKQLHQEMHDASESLDFEKAGALLNNIKHIERTLEKQLVDKITGHDIDALGLYWHGEDVIISQMIYRNGKLVHSQQHHFSHLADNDQELLSSFLIQHYQYKEEIPDEILIPVAIEDWEILEEIITERRSKKVSIHTPQKGDKKSMVEMAEANASAAFKHKTNAKELRENALWEMKEKLKLTSFPKRIECFDNSTLSGSEVVACMIAFTNGQKDSSRYRKYKIKMAAPGDDYGAMREVLTRRYKRAQEENDLPDLIIIDGGKGHLNIALKVLTELNIVTVNVIGLAKEEGRHDKGMTLEQVFLPNVKDPILLKRTSPVLFLLQEIRDEAHRFAIGFHRQRHRKSALASQLDMIPGIGIERKKKLLKHFGSLHRIENASLEDLQKVPGLTKANVQAVMDFIQKRKIAES